MTDAAHVAYEAYSKTTNNKNFQGNEMPKFNDLPPKIQEAWANAARAAGEHAMAELDKARKLRIEEERQDYLEAAARRKCPLVQRPDGTIGQDELDLPI